MTIRLDVFAEPEAQAFLDVYNITNVKRRREILKYSARLPMIMSWLAAPEGDEQDTSLPAQSVVERFLRWVTNPYLRQEALLGAIPRLFNLDILAVLTDSQSQPDNGQSAFDWLLTMPFVQQGPDGWRYHQVVRNMMLHYQRLKSPQAYRHLHNTMAEFYYKKRNELHCSDEEQWINEQWRRDTLAYTYHFLVADPTRRWTNVMNLFAIAVRKRRSFATEMIEMLAMSDVQDELSREQCAIVRLFQEQLQAIQDSDLQAGFDMFDRLCAMNDLSSQAKGHILTYRGECYRLRGEWDKALRDFGDALECLPGDVRTLVRRGTTSILMQDYHKALNDLNQAIMLEPKDAWALAIRGETYRRMKEYQEALSDLNQAIALDGKNAWAIAVRGETYYRMEQLANALEDLNHALALDDKNIWALVKRSETHHKMGNTQASLTDLQHALMLDERYTRVLATSELLDILTDIEVQQNMPSASGPLSIPPSPPLVPNPLVGMYTPSETDRPPTPSDPYIPYLPSATARPAQPSALPDPPIPILPSQPSAPPDPPTPYMQPPYTYNTGPLKHDRPSTPMTKRRVTWTLLPLILVLLFLIGLLVLMAHY